MGTSCEEILSILGYSTHRQMMTVNRWLLRQNCTGDYGTLSRKQFVPIPLLINITRWSRPWQQKMQLLVLSKYTVKYHCKLFE